MKKSPSKTPSTTIAIPTEKELIQLTIDRAASLAEKAGRSTRTVFIKAIGDGKILRRMLDRLDGGSNSPTLNTYQRLHEAFARFEKRGVPK